MIPDIHKLIGKMCSEKCPKCQGQLFIVWSDNCLVRKCLQCSREYEVNKNAYGTQYADNRN